MTLADLVNLLINGTVEGLLMALPALALTLVMAIARFPNAATGDYMTVSAYAAVGVQWLIPGSLLLAAVGAIAAGVAVSLLFYLWVFRALRGRPLVASLVASIGVAFFARSILTFSVGQDQLALQVPMMRAWNFSGIRVLPLDLVVAAVSIVAMALLFTLLRLTPEMFSMWEQRARAAGWPADWRLSDEVIEACLQCGRRPAGNVRPPNQGTQPIHGRRHRRGLQRDRFRHQGRPERSGNGTWWLIPEIKQHPRAFR